MEHIKSENPMSPDCQCSQPTNDGQISVTLATGTVREWVLAEFYFSMALNNVHANLDANMSNCLGTI